MADPDCFLCGMLEDRDGYVEVSHNLRMCADIAPITCGHSLIYTSEHLRSYSEASDTDLECLKYALEKVSEATDRTECSVIFFEHGPSPARVNITGCCDHAHVHILPVVEAAAQSHEGSKFLENLDRVLSDLVSTGVARPIGVFNIDDIAQLKGEDYFWVSTDAKIVRAFILEAPERQLLRRVAVNALGLHEFFTWDLYDEQSAKRTTELLRERYGTPPVWRP